MIIVPCAHCGAFSDQHDPLNAPPATIPELGDASVCFECGEVSIFDFSECCQRLVTRVPTAEETARVDAEPAMTLIREALQQNPDSVDEALEAVYSRIGESSL